MIKINGISYMTLKEAAYKYGLSISWFKLRIKKKEEPHAFQIKGKGKIYYDIIKTDEWFKNNMKEIE